MTKRDLIDYWLETAAEDLETAESLFNNRRYHHCLFFCHLTIEKLLKGLIFVKTGNHALPIHDLTKLAAQAKIKLNQKQSKDLQEMSSWNIQARYDNIKREFYKKATAEFTGQWFAKIKVYYLWLKNQY